MYCIQLYYVGILVLIAQAVFTRKSYNTLHFMRASFRAVRAGRPSKGGTGAAERAKVELTFLHLAAARQAGRRGGVRRRRLCRARWRQ